MENIAFFFMPTHREMTDRKAFVLVLIRVYAEHEESLLLDEIWLRFSMEIEGPIFAL